MVKVQKTISIKEEQGEYLEKTDMNFSRFVRQKLNQRMKEDGFDVE
jgi:hypothetical protein